MKSFLHTSLIIISILFFGNSFGQANDKQLIICKQFENSKLLKSDNSILFVTNANNQLNITSGIALGLFPKGDKSIALSIDNSITSSIVITIKDISGEEFSISINPAEITCVTKKLKLSNSLSVLSIKREGQQATFNLQEYFNITK